MWRVLAVVTIISAIWGVGTLLPKSDLTEAEHVSNAVGIATQGNPKAAGMAASAPAAAPASPATSPAEESRSWTTTVSVGTPEKSPEVLDEADRTELVMALQRELRRVGCYQGRINGSWNSRTRRAVTAFAEAAAIATPSEQPDRAMLELAAGIENRACGAPCAVGQRPNAEGRCRPVEKEIIASRELAGPPARAAAAEEQAETTEEQVQEKVTDEGPIVVASVVESGLASAMAAAAGEKAVPSPEPAGTVAGAEAAAAEQDEPTLTKPPKRRVAAARTNLLPADAFAPVPGAGSRTKIARNGERQQKAARGKRTVLATLDGPLPSAPRKTARRYANASSYYGLGVTVTVRKQRARADVSPRASGKQKRRSGYAAVLRSFIKGMNGGSLR